MKEPLFMQMKVAYDKMLDEARREVKNHAKIAYYADEVADFAKRIADIAREQQYARSAIEPTEPPSEAEAEGGNWG